MPMTPDPTRLRLELARTVQPTHDRLGHQSLTLGTRA
jgi:hypothetical protein